MDYKNDNRTPRDRITGEFLSELLFTELGGDDCLCTDTQGKTGCSSDDTMNRRRQSLRTSASVQNTSKRGCTCRQTPRSCNTNEVLKCRSNGNVEISGNYSLVMAYVQMQQFGDLFELDEGLHEGTIFKKLRFPFYPTPCRRECE
ncbi:MAG: spore coat associated protein CotJA [Ruminococcaceae bacterium]|nr:spore coat associated protein CotJA [Oscillospiraceae bacterium]